MKIATLGAKNPWDDLFHIENAFVALGHEINNETPDLIYIRRNPYFDAIKLKEKTGAKLICHVLDIPPFLLVDGYNTSKYTIVDLPKDKLWKKDFDPEYYHRCLEKADVVTANSDEVRWQLKEWCGIDSITTYAPIQKSVFLNFERKNKFLYVGRSQDPNKRFNIANVVANLMGEKIIVVGEPQEGHINLGRILNEKLIILYNTSQFLLFPSATEGLGLPPLEAIIAGCIPIVCSDNPTNYEFLKEFVLPPDPKEIYKAITNEGWVEAMKFHCEQKALLYSHKFHPITVANDIINIYKKTL